MSVSVSPEFVAVKGVDINIPSFIITSITSAPAGTLVPKTLFPISIPVVSLSNTNLLPETISTVSILLVIPLIKSVPVPKIFFGTYLISTFLSVLTVTYPFALFVFSPTSPPPNKTELSRKLNTLPFASSEKS